VRAPSSRTIRATVCQHTATSAGLRLELTQAGHTAAHGSGTLTTPLVRPRCRISRPLDSIGGHHSA
jgi:hypothetical protein